MINISPREEEEKEEAKGDPNEGPDVSESEDDLDERMATAWDDAEGPSLTQRDRNERSSCPQWENPASKSVLQRFSLRDKKVVFS